MLGAMQAEICPQRASQKTPPGQIDRRVFKEMDVRAGDGGVEFLDERWRRMAVELVVPKHQDDRHGRKMLLNPRQRLCAGMNVAGQHHDIGGARRRFEWAEFQVQVA